MKESRSSQVRGGAGCRARWGRGREWTWAESDVDRSSRGRVPVSGVVQGLPSWLVAYTALQRRSMRGGLYEVLRFRCRWFNGLELEFEVFNSGTREFRRLSASSGVFGARGNGRYRTCRAASGVAMRCRFLIMQVIMQQCAIIPAASIQKPQCRLDKGRISVVTCYM